MPWFLDFHILLVALSKCSLTVRIQLSNNGTEYLSIYCTFLLPGVASDLTVFILFGNLSLDWNMRRKSSPALKTPQHSCCNRRLLPCYITRCLKSVCAEKNCLLESLHNLFGPAETNCVLNEWSSSTLFLT